MTFTEVTVNVDGAELYHQTYPDTPEGQGEMTQFLADIRHDAATTDKRLYEVYEVPHDHDPSCGECQCNQFIAEQVPTYVWNGPDNG
jgi:hypothetical protein